MKPRHTAEQSTTNVNKSAKMGRVGFGVLNFANSPAFSAPLQKSLDMNPVATPTPFVVEPVLVTDTKTVINDISQEEKIVSASIAEEVSHVSKSGFAAVFSETRTPAAKIEKSFEKELEPVFVQQTISQPAMQMASAPISQSASQSSHNSVPNADIGVDPAEDESMVCISCQ
jgi:hypothetical protein